MTADDANVMPSIGRPGRHSLTVNGAIPDEEIRAAIDESYDIVLAKVPKARRP